MRASASLVLALSVACVRSPMSGTDELGSASETTGGSETGVATTSTSETTSSETTSAPESSGSDDMGMDGSESDSEGASDSEGGVKFDTLLIGDGGDFPLIDCSEVPPAPLLLTQLSAPRGYHDVAFDEDGKIIGSDGVSLVKVDYGGATSLFVPGLGSVQQMDWLDDGDLAVAADFTASIMRIGSNGTSSVLASNIGAYGLITGDDEMLYAATTSAIFRVDPGNGSKTMVVQPFGPSPRVLNFSPDNKKLYIGTYLGNGTLYAVDWDDRAMQAVGAPYAFASGVGGGAYHDTLSVDACGNLYVSDFSTQTMYRISPEGETSVYINFNNGGLPYGHGAEFGNGVGGWREDALYLAQPYNNNSVAEVVIGVPSRKYGWMTKP